MSYVPHGGGSSQLFLMTSSLFKDVVFETYKTKVIHVMRTRVQNFDEKHVEEFMMGVYILHTVLVWLTYVLISSRFPRFMSCIQSILLHAFLVALFWVVYLLFYV
jgi:hypothetical protein